MMFLGALKQCEQEHALCTIGQMHQHLQLWATSGISLFQSLLVVCVCLNTHRLGFVITQERDDPVVQTLTCDSHLSWRCSASINNVPIRPEGLRITDHGYPEREATAGRLETWPTTSIRLADPCKLLVEISQKAEQSQQEISITKAKIAGLQRESRKSEITASEINSLPADANVWEGCGKM